MRICVAIAYQSDSPILTHETFLSIKAFQFCDPGARLIFNLAIRRVMKIYKVMTQKDRAFGGKFNPEKVEEALNGLAKEGWEVTGVVSAEFPSFGGGRQELVIFLSKEV
jgi:hypothetical protein